MRIRYGLLLLVWVLFACHPPPERSEHSALAIASGTAVEKGYSITFPEDHGIHQEQGIEWWYLTANLTSDSGESFGVQWTLFRTLAPSPIKSVWWDNNLYFAHFAMQHEQKHVAFERFARSGQADVTSAPFEAVIDDWQLRSEKSSFLPLQLNAAEKGYGVSLLLNNSPVTLHGTNGYSQKTQSGHASYYFSYPFLRVTGEISFAGQDHVVTGHAWYDREWSASLLDKDQIGWDWFSLVDKDLQNGLMLFCIRGREEVYEYCGGTIIAADGSAKALKQDDISMSVVESLNVDNRTYPQKWRVTISDFSPIIIETITRDSRNNLSIQYWEGRITSSGGFVGKGYGEITGN
ncbi:lipocalin-like domain-containing protein [Alteromonas sp. ASW11-130]|uniref:lipocalin-like domain-containing protein n=1 Tax=Alteromonas sp. ASW11-130 TaxID=3015775 RepID=UPI0022420F79|nr:lipocalin-like domain-containing protein [Alteromonas sp. ASW11-130]MCW8091097.1 ABC transporter [Alteromonas sp. ASW11-130]